MKTSPQLPSVQIVPGSVTACTDRLTAKPAMRVKGAVARSPSLEELERCLSEVNALIAFYRNLQCLCYLAFAFVGSGVVLAVTGLFLHAG